LLPQKALKLEINIPPRMRDGTILYADILRPETDSPIPAIIMRTPYDKGSFLGPRGGGYMNPRQFALSGYAVIMQDCRGTGVSDGEHYHFRNETEDGYDTVEWAAEQSWCDGNVGMYGPSYLGGTQWLAAIMQPPHLKAICPAEAAATLRGLPTCSGGVFNLQGSINHNIRFGFNGLRRSALPPERLKQIGEQLNHMMNHIEEQFVFLPLKDVPSMQLVKELKMAPFYTDWLEHIDDDVYWNELNSPVPLQKVAVPAFHLSGWYDFMASGVLLNYIEMKKRGGSQKARDHQKMIIGPWVHGSELPSTVGELNFGTGASGAAVNVTRMHIRWFDYWLKGIENGIVDEPPVKIFVMGDNVWRDENEWPLARTEYAPYYFHSNGKANSRLGDGFLSTAPPIDNEEKDVYLYDPRNPVPTKWGVEGANSYAGEVQDQQELEKRPDILIYTSAVLERDLEVTGPIEIKVWAASSAVDTDFTGKLVDVWPNMQAFNLVEGIVRARYRKSESHAELIEPDRVYEYTINLKATSNVFKAGHRIRVEISSSCFPRYDRNLNTGHPIGQDREMKVAVQTVYHDKNYPSHIVLPVIPR